MTYLVYITGNNINTNSTEVVAHLKVDSMLEESDRVDENLCKGITKPEVHAE